jgi:hypothetical protein
MVVGRLVCPAESIAITRIVATVRSFSPGSVWRVASGDTRRRMRCNSPMRAWATVLQPSGLCRRRVAASSIAALAEPVNCYSDENRDDGDVDRYIGKIEAATGHGWLDPVDDSAA